MIDKVIQILQTKPTNSDNHCKPNKNTNNMKKPISQKTSNE